MTGSGRRHHADDDDNDGRHQSEDDDVSATQVGDVGRHHGSGVVVDSSHLIPSMHDERGLSVGLDFDLRRVHIINRSSLQRELMMMTTMADSAANELSSLIVAG